MTGELDDLAAHAAAVEAAAPQVGGLPPEEQAEPQPQAADRNTEAGLILNIAKPAIIMAVPYVQDAPEDYWQGLREPIAELLAHYDVDVGEYLNSPWAKLAMAAAPLAMHGVERWRKSNAANDQGAGQIAGHQQAETEQGKAVVIGAPQAAD